MTDYLKLMESADESATPGSGNKYLQIMDDFEAANNTQFAASVSSSVSSNPDEVARKKRIANLLQVPLAAVDGDPETSKQLATQKTLEADTVKAPALKQKYTDSDFARLAHDQSASLGTVERIMRDFAAGFGGDFVGSGIAGAGHTLHSLEHLTNSKSILADTLTSVGETTKKYWQGLAPKDQTFADQVVRGVGQIAGQLPAMAVSPVAGISMMYGQGADQMKEKIERDKASQKADQVRQDLEILSGGAITGVTEWVSSKLLLKPPQILALKNALLDKVLKVAAGGATEGIQESLENIGQDLAHIAMTNPESKIAFGDALEAGGVGAVVGAIASGVVQGALHIRARRTQQSLTDLSDATQVQKLKERDQGTYQGFTDSVVQHLASTSDGAVENLYIDANTFNQVMQESKIDPQKVALEVPSIKGQLDEALVTGGDIVIPLGEFAGKIAGTDIGDVLTPHLRSAPNAVSMAEMEQATKMAPDLQSRADEITAKQGRSSEFVKSANEVHKTVLDQINETGFYAAPVARAYSSLVRDFYVTTAASMGVAPTELYQMYPYKVVSGEVGPGEMTQGQTNTQSPEFKAWFEDSKVVDEKGNPLVVYHGTNNPEFTEFSLPEGDDNYDLGKGFYFTPILEDAKRYANIGKKANRPRLMPVYLKLKNPLTITYPVAWSQELAEEIRNGKYDGVIAKDENGNIVEIKVNNSTQIKSVNNQGTFDPNDPNILRQAAKNGKLTPEIEESLGVDYGTTEQPGKNLADISAKDGEHVEPVAPIEAAEQAAILDGTRVPQQTIVTIKEAQDWLEAHGFPRIAPQSESSNLISRLMENEYFNSLTIFDRIRVASQLERPIRKKDYNQNTTPKSNRKLEGQQGNVRSGTNQKVEGSGIVAADTIRGCDHFCFECYALKGAAQAAISHQHPIMQELKGTIRDGEILRIGEVGDPSKNWSWTDKQVRNVIDASNKHGAKVNYTNNVFYITKLLNLRGFNPETARNLQVTIDPLLPAHMWRTMENVIRLKSAYPEVNINVRIRSVATNNAELQDSTQAAVEFANRFKLPIIETRMRFVRNSSLQLLELQERKYKRVGNQWKLQGNNLKGKGDQVIVCDEKGGGCPKCLGCAKTTRTMRTKNLKQQQKSFADTGAEGVSLDATAPIFDPVGGKVLYQPGHANKRGGFNPATLTTILNEQSDYSTFLHETSHFFLTTYADLAMQPNAPLRVREDMQTLLDWFGVKDIETWNAMSLEEQRPYHEQFAYNYEIYLFEGKAPNPKIQTIFERMSAWLKRIYVSIRDELNQVYRQEHGSDLPMLTGEIRQVMDRMLASDKQIREAETIRGMVPIFQTQKESGMSDEEWSAYVEMQKEAHEAALAEHRTASLRQMKWLSNAKSKILKSLQREVRNIRKRVTAEVADDVKSIPVYRAIRFIKHRIYEIPGNANQKTRRVAVERSLSSTKLSIEALKEMYGDAANAPWRYLPTGKNGIMATDGVHPDMIADMFEFKSGDEMVRAILAAPPMIDTIRERTDRRMLEEHGELTDPQAQANAVDRAVHNEARARFIGVELRHLAKSQRPVRVMQEAARQAARSILGNKAIADIRPNDFASAEARASKAAETAMKKGDTSAAVQAKEHQLLQNQLASEALKAREYISKSLESFKKVFASDSKIGKSRDMNYVNVARAILAQYGLGYSEQPASAYLSKIKAYDPEFYAEIEPMITAHQAMSKPMNQLTLDEFTDLTEQVQALWHLSRRNKQIEINGQLLDRKEVISELNDAIRLLDTNVERPGYSKAMSNWEKAKIKLMGMRASMRRVESWVDAMDRGNPDGPFRKYIWNPISEAVTKYRMAKKDYMVKYLDILKDAEPLLKGTDIVAPELGYTFKPQELLHALLHTGNQSNKRKLLLGRGWGELKEDGETLDSSRWDAFIDRAHKEGILTKAHYDFAQKVWDLLESMKPAAQKAHREMYGFYFNEITANPINTPWGTYAGGYVPAVTDPDLVTEGAMRNEQETSLVDNSFMFPTTGRGFTQGRVEYNKPLLLNLGYLAGHIDKVLRFTHIEPRVKDVARIVKTNRSFAEAMDSLDQTVRGDMLVPWLQRTAMQMVSIPSKGWGGRAADTFFREIRTRTGLQMMVGNVVNTLQQFTGISISALKVKPKHLRNALWQYMRQPKETADMIQEKSDYMKTRMNADQYELQRIIDDMLLNPNKYEKLQEFASQHGYFMQAATQNVVDTITWAGAYNQATEEGLNEQEAVRNADSAVRMTQGSFAPEDVSRFETGSAFMRAFTQFYSYFNMQANLLGTEFLNVVRNLGVKKGAGKLLYIYTFGFMVPAVLSQLIIEAIGGFDDGDDDEYDLGDAVKLFFNSQWRSGAALFPVAGQAVSAAVNRFNHKPYDDKISASPAISIIDAVAGTPYDVYKAIAEDGSWGRAIKDLLTLLGMLTRLPLGQLGKPAGYLADVAQGKADPQSSLDIGRGVVSGKDVNRKQ